MTSHILAVAGGGALGAVLRFAMSSVMGSCAVVIVNLLGCFLIGALVSFLAAKGSAPQIINLFLVVGLLGGFTTFSAFSFETMHFIDTHKYMHAALYVTVSVVGGLGAFILGRFIVKTFI